MKDSRFLQVYFQSLYVASAFLIWLSKSKHIVTTIGLSSTNDVKILNPFLKEFDENLGV